jgi:hypothetical protein
MRRVPIMKRHTYLEQLYKNYPVLFVDDYNQVTEQLLIDNDFLFQQIQELDFNCLYLNNFFNKTVDGVI